MLNARAVKWSGWSSRAVNDKGIAGQLEGPEDEFE